VHGVRIEYEQTRRGYRRREYTGHRGETEYAAEAARVPLTVQRFTQMAELPAAAPNVHLYSDDTELPANYRSAVQRVR
jgi:hypothetical protein